MWVDQTFPNKPTTSSPPPPPPQPSSPSSTTTTPDPPKSMYVCLSVRASKFARHHTAVTRAMNSLTASLLLM